MMHRLTRWYRAGVDLHARLPLLAVYLGHESLLGTEVYLSVGVFQGGAAIWLGGLATLTIRPAF